MNRSEGGSKVPEWTWYMVMGPLVLIAVGLLAGYNTSGIGPHGPDEVTYYVLAIEIAAGWVLGLLVYVGVRTTRRIHRGRAAD